MLSSFFAYLMGFLYVVAGLNHFRDPKFYVKMIQDFLPYPLEIVYLSGSIEIMLGIGVCIPATRSISAIGIILMLIAIFPANINMAIHAEEWKYSPFLLYLRLPLQLLLIYWAYLYTK